MSGGRVVDLSAMVPPTVSFSAYSNTGTSAATTTIYLLNTNSYNALVTTNGSAAASIVNSYGDGFSGKYYEQLMRSANNGKGIRVYGYSIQYTITSSGNQDPVGLQNAAFTALHFTGINGNSLPMNLQNSLALRNTQYLSGLLTFKWDAFLDSATQFSCSLPVASTVQITFFTTPTF